MLQFYLLLCSTHTLLSKGCSFELEGMTVKSHAVYYCYLGSIGVRRETQRAGLCIRSLAAAALAARSRLGIRASLAAVVTCVYHNKEDYVNKNQNGSQTTYFTSFYSDECSKFTQGLFQKLFGFQRPIWTAKLQSTGCSGLLGHWVSPKD